MDEAVAHYEQAIRLDGAAGLRPWVVRARMGLARALQTRGEIERARQMETIAAAEGDDLGITGRRDAVPTAPAVPGG